MIRGIRFRLKSQWADYLNKIFQNIDVKNYDWRISEDEIICSDGMKKSPIVFTEKELDGDAFSLCLQKAPYYVIHANIRAYLPEDKNKNEIIHNYSDFKKSHCLFLLLCYDTTNAEFYCKDMNILEKVRLACKENKLRDIFYITDDNDNRDTFHV